jgi:hypothetical protein
MTIGRVVLLLVLGSAVAAVVVALATRPSAPVELGKWLSLIAASAATELLAFVEHEHMFAGAVDGTRGR